MSGRVAFRRLLALANSIEAQAPTGKWVPCKIRWVRSGSGKTPVLTCLAGDVGETVKLRVVLDPCRFGTDGEEE